MQIITDENICNILAKEYYQKKEHEVLSNWKIKKTLNENFKPDSYIFFKNKKCLIPLVSKNNVAYFFGGNLPFNDYNLVPKSKLILNECLDYLKSEKINFRLLSIKNDTYDILSKNNKIFDVPYNQNWIIEDISDFNIETFIAKQKKKKRDKLKSAKKILINHNFVSVDRETYKMKFMSKIFNLNNEAFKKRGKNSCWENKERLYNDMFDIFFSGEFKNLNRVLIDNSDNVIASYNLVANNKEIFLAFSNCYNYSIKNLQFLLYIDLLEQSRLLASEYKNKISLNAARGNFGYKSRMSFIPQPMYCLVHDKNWNISLNNDLSEEMTNRLYKRNFGCFVNSN